MHAAKEIENTVMTIVFISCRTPAVRGGHPPPERKVEMSDNVESAAGGRTSPPRCWTCKFFEYDAPGTLGEWVAIELENVKNGHAPEKLGMCRRRPPAYGVHRVSPFFDWCGDHTSNDSLDRTAASAGTVGGVVGKEIP